MNVILYAIPMFFILIVIELIYDLKTRSGSYRVNDAISSLNVGILSRVNGIVRKFIPFTIYAYIVTNWSIFSFEPSIWYWLFVFVLYDFCYYWKHRLGHEINLLWAAHVVHHSSEEYNLTTALRQTSGSVFNWIFYVPLALLGVDIITFITVAAVNLVYQFWVHTRFVPKMGWYELFFVTPSNHRVHHATNQVYIDRNYGGVFILWDRLFGTFQEELEHEACMYGIRKPLKSWNPIWTNLHFYNQLLKDAWRAEKWKDKLLIWFKPTGWRPEDVEKKYPLIKFNPDTFKKFDVKIPLINNVYSVFQLLVIIALTVFVLINVSTMTVTEQLFMGGYLVLNCIGIGWVLEGKRWAKYFEVIRIALLPFVVYQLGYADPILYAAITATVIGGVLAILLQQTQTTVYEEFDSSNVSV